MGTTGRFGGGGHGLTGPKHIWYDTDYSELYKGLAVVIGFFLFLVLLLLVFILISYLRKWYRLKKHRPSNADASGNAQADNAPYNGQQLMPMSKVSSVKTSTASTTGPPGGLVLGGSGTPPTISSINLDEQKKYCKKHSRVGLPQLNNHSGVVSSSGSSQPQTPKLSSMLHNPNLVMATPVAGCILPAPPPPPAPSSNIELIHDPNIVMSAASHAGVGVAVVSGMNSSASGAHYQEFPPTAAAATQATSVVYPMVSATSQTQHPNIVSLNEQARKDSRSSSIVPQAVPTNVDIRVPGRSSLATITLS